MVPKGWQRHSLGDLLEFKNGFNTEKANYGQGTPFINVSEVLKHESLTADLIPGQVSVTEKELLANSVVHGDILFNRTSETTDEVGFTAVYLDTVPVIFGGFVIRGRPTNGSLHPEFTKYALRQPSVRSEIIRRSQGAVRSNIGQGELSKVEVKLPPLPEQRKIADILSTWDAAIEKTEALLATAKAQKRALMQSLLTGKRRFPEFEGQPWKEVRIGDVACEVSERNKDDAALTVISCTKTIGFVNSLDYFKKKVFSDDLSGYKIIRRNQIGYPSNHVEEGSIGIQNLHDAALVSPIYTIFETGPEVDPMYLFRVLKTDRYRQIFAAATSASVDRRGSLRWKAFATIKVRLPSLHEQRRINETLSTADNEISELETSVAKLRTEKKALMQQLLTGKRRVVVDA